MRAFIASTFVILVASAAAAQTHTPSAPVALPVLANFDLVGKVVAAPDLPGDEFLFRAKGWTTAYVVGRLHPSKSGNLGTVPAPGLCLESAIAFTIVPDAVVVLDANGDGKDDLVGTVGTTVQVLYGNGLVTCR